MTTLQALITKLGSAEEGSYALECEMAAELGWTFMKGSAALLQGPYWVDPDENEHKRPPAYFTSLDASLQGENITSIYRFDNGTWSACHEKGHDVYGGKAKTEILARRLACLKAMADE